METAQHTPHERRRHPASDEDPMTTATATTTTIDTPLGRLTLTASETGLTRCTFRSVDPGTGPADARSQRWLDQARRELEAYFAGELRAFTVPVDLRRVSPLHRRILDGLTRVGYGLTTTYGELAVELGLVEDGPRQVGGAMARNPVLIVVPCHRVLGAGGKLTGYAGGPAAKQRLLDLESRDRALQPTLAW
jgi:methylated-DNA-[protein]-cysteine S-methyltransferase